MQPHDRFFRHVFSQPEHAEGELRALLPAALSARIDWASLRLVPASFVDQELADLRSDLLFSARIGDRELLLYLLLEHQSSADRWMPMRMLGYMVRIWEDHLREHPGAERLPAIVPMVVHHSERGWTAPVALGALLDLDDAARATLASQIPEFELLLDDLSAARDEDLRSRSMTAFGQVALFCLARARTSPDLVAELTRFRDRMMEILEAPNGVAALRTVLRYILEATETPPEKMEELVKQLGPKAEEAYMTGAQKLRAEGEAKGRAEGEAKGRAEGRAETLLKLLELKFGTLPEGTIERVRGARIEELDGWVERVLAAATLQDVLGT